MAWRDQLRTASFKGVGFLVAGAEGSFGRQVVVHQFPKKATAFAEDIGAKPSEFSIEAFVVGENYFTARDALLSICQEEGPGDLVHPFLGKKYVVCTAITLKESSQDGGIATFSLSFVETTPPLQPVSVADYAGKLATAAAQARSVATQALEDTFSVVGYATSVVDAAQEAVESVAQVFDDLQGEIRKQLEDVANLAYKVRKLKASVGDIIGIPSELAAQFEDTFLTLAKAFGGGKEAAVALARFATTTEAITATLAVLGATTAIKQSKTNAQSMDVFTKQVAASVRAEALSEAEFESLDEAIAFREALIEDIEALKELVSDEAFQALEDLRIAVIRAVPAAGEDLSKIVTITTEDTVPSLAFIYDAQESLELEEDLILRNALVHPGFIAVGTGLKVLSNG